MYAVITREQAEAIEVDWREPAKVPCSNPPQCEEADVQIARDNHWDKWDIVVKSRDQARLGAPIRIKGYTNAMMRAWQAGIPMAHPTPRAEDEAGTILFVLQRP